MTTPDELVVEIKALLQRLPTVEVLATRVTRTHCWIPLTLASWESLLILQSCAEASNVLFHGWARHEPGSPEAVSDAARAIMYEYRVESAGTEALRERLESLGTFLVWRLHVSDLIATPDANRLLDMFHGAHVPRPRPREHS